MYKDFIVILNINLIERAELEEIFLSQKVAPLLPPSFSNDPSIRDTNQSKHLSYDENYYRARDIRKQQ